MDAPTLAVRVNNACEVLTDLRYVRDEANTSAALRTICRLLNEAAGGEERSFIYQVAISAGGVSALLGIIRSSPSITVLADAASCLSLLVQGNERAAPDLASRDVLSPLLPLLYPRKQQRSSSEPSKYPLSSYSRLLWTRERLPVYEAALSALRKLTYHSSDLQRTLAQRGGIRLIIELSTSPEFLSETSSYSLTAIKEFAKLALGKKYIANAASAPKTTRSDLLEQFPALASLEHGSEYPYYVVDLVTYERKWVVDSIIDTGLVWPSHAPFPEGAEPVWTCVGVVCVEDPGHVWCQFCIDQPKPKVDAMVTALRNMAPPTGYEVIDDIPEVGDFCVAYFEPKYCHAPSSIDEGALWGRGQVLGVEPGAKLRLLSLDFGTTATLPLSHVRPFLRECRGMPPFAVPCKVLGVAPIPVCTVVQENAAAVLRNLAYEDAAYRKEIVAFKGAEALLQLAHSCDVAVAQQAVAALLNMTSSEGREMGERGVLGSLLELVLREKTHSSLLYFSLATIHNLIAGSPQNLKRLTNQNAAEKLSDLLGQRSLNGKAKEMLEKILKILNPSSPRQMSSINGGIGITKKTPPVYRCLGDQEPGNEVETKGQDEEGEEEVSGAVITTKTFSHNSYVGFVQNETRSFKNVGPEDKLTPWMLQRTVCAMMNTGDWCVIYVGLSPSGRIHGVKMDRKERDRLCMDIDRMMKNGFNPCIKHNQYKILFVPVVSGSHLVLPETYVIQLELEAKVGRKTVYTIDNKEVEGATKQQYYLRCGRTNVEMSLQEMGDRLAEEESNEHGGEIVSLLQNIDTLCLSLDHVTKRLSGYQ